MLRVLSGENMKRLIVTGSRHWTDIKTIKDALLEAIDGQWESTTIVHGDCPTGADAIAHSIALLFGLTIERYPANWNKYGRTAGPLRNQGMADLGADVCLAFPMSDSRGTFDMIKRAKAAGIKTIIYKTG